MNTEKKTFAPAEVEVIRFEKTDVIATSQMTIILSGEPAQGCPLDGDD